MLTSEYWMITLSYKTMLTKAKVLTVILFFFFVKILVAQKNSDTTEINSILRKAQELATKHKYSEAVQSAHEALDLSSKLNFDQGTISSLLILGSSQKSLQNYASSLNYYLRALSEIEKKNNSTLLQETNIKVGELFQEWGVPEKALPYYKAALNSLSLNETKKSFLLERIAEAYHRLNENNLALQYYFQLLEVTKKEDLYLQTNSTLQKIALIYYQANDINNSLKYNLEILDLNKFLKDTVNTAVTLNTIGNHYKDLKNLNKALDYYQQALAINQQIRRNNQRDNRIVTNLINIGTIYQTRGDARNSIRSFNDALTLKNENGTPLEIAVMHNYLASLYLSQTDYAEAESHTHEAISLLTGTDNKRMLATNLKRLTDIYAKQGNYEKALKSYQSYSLLKDSLLYREQLSQEKEKLKDYLIENAEREAKLIMIDQEVQSLKLRNEKEIAEREKQQIALLLKEKELQNVSLQKEQSEKERAVQLLQLQRGKAEQEKQQQSILLLEQKRDLQNAELQRIELLDKERAKEIAFKNTTLALQQAQLDQANARQRSLIYISILFMVLVMFVMIGYYIKQKDNHILKAQKEQIELINRSLVELNEEKNDLISIVAHDLKSPLNQISGMLEIIKLTTKDQTEEQQGYIAKIEQSSNRLKKMVTKILDVSAIESKTLNLTLEKIDISKLLDEIVYRFVILAERKKIIIVKEFQKDLPMLASDISYLSEVLENLMSNAVKYSPLGKQITVTLHRINNFIRIEFIDQGHGINEKDMKFLFGKYHKLSNKPTAGEDSTGLGLSIVKKYVLALNGRVWCESVEGKGSNFIVELPVS